jgi:membrane fusion protein (multidrug efflux system)
VEAGQILVRFDTSEEQAALAAAQAEARLARLTFERRQALRSRQTVSAQDLDQAREEHAGAVARVATLKAGIDKKTIRAPFRARVGLTDLQPGAYLDVGTPIAMLQGVAADAYVDFSLPQEAAAAIAPGAGVRLVGQRFPDGAASAEIIAGDASVDGSSRAVRFRALAKGLGDSLRPGAYVDVVVVTAPPQPALFVPLTSVRRASFGQHVYLLVEDGGMLRARQRIVQTGPVVGDEIAIVDGLAEGDLVAGAGSFKLREGLMVQADAAPGRQSSLN